MISGDERRPSDSRGGKKEAVRFAPMPAVSFPRSCGVARVWATLFFPNSGRLRRDRTGEAVRPGGGDGVQAVRGPSGGGGCRAKVGGGSRGHLPELEKKAAVGGGCNTLGVCH